MNCRGEKINAEMKKCAGHLIHTFAFSEDEKMVTVQL